MKVDSQIIRDEIEMHKAVIVQKDAEIEQLLQKLQKQQASQDQDATRLQEESEREVAAVVEELQIQLLQAENAKRWAVEELEAAQLQIEKLREREEEFKRLELAAQNKVYGFINEGCILCHFVLG